MDNVVRTWEDVELTDAELENIYGGGFPLTLTGNVFGYPVTISGITATALSLDATSTGTLTTDVSTANVASAAPSSAPSVPAPVPSVSHSLSTIAPGTSITYLPSTNGHTAFKFTKVFG
jgi:hypothetical protein